MAIPLVREGRGTVTTLVDPRNFLDRAAECERMADEAGNTNDRDTMLHLASRWRSLADAGEIGEKRILR